MARSNQKRDGLQPRGGNTWRITVGAGRDPETGKYIVLRETFHGTKTDARRRRNELRADAARGTAARPDRETIASFLERYVEHRLSVGKVRPKTAAVYRGYLRREVVPRIGAMRVADVRPVHLQKVLDAALKSGLAARSVVQVHRILHAAFKQAVRWQLLSVNPSDGVTPPKLESPALVTPSPEEVAELLGEVEEPCRVPIAVAAATGLRRGEVAALRWADIDLDSDHPCLRVQGSLQRVDGELVVFPPKTARGLRTVPLPASVVPALRQLRADQAERRLLAGEGWHDGGFAFDRGDGLPLSPDGLSHAFLEARKRAGIDKVRLHDLRHAWATLQMAHGTNARVVSDVLGHAHVSFTMQVYSHPDLEVTRAVVDAVDGELGEALRST